MNTSKFILIGSGDFATEITEYISEKNKESSNKKLIISDIVSKTEDRLNEIYNILGYEPTFHNSLSTIERKDKKNALICLGSAESRHECYQELKINKFTIGSFTHKTAWLANSSKINEGVIVCPYVFIGANTIIGANAVLNVRATIGHDVKIGKSAVISPHVNLNGKSICGDASFIGAGTIMDPECSIGDFSKVSSGSIVKGDFGNGFLLSGNPAKGRKMFKIKAKVEAV
jgi:sugar O-acyltransferase (sialic acid O-acetyltransferase NeuD family)